MKIKKTLTVLFVLVMSLIAHESASAQKNSLAADQSLARGEEMFSANKLFRLAMQDDGNLVVYQIGQVVKTRKGTRVKPINVVMWSTKTQNLSVKNAVMQKDGNLVLYNYAGKPVWNSKSSHVKNIDSHLVMQDDGNLVIYRPNNTVVWSAL